MHGIEVDEVELHEVGAVDSIVQMGHRVATFRLATDRPGSSGSGRTDWHTIVAWEALVPLLERRISKGDRVFVEGRVEAREERVRGRRRSRTEIVAEEVIPLGR